MKLWHSFLKELQLSSRGFYFYVEIAMAVILLVVLLFVMPENFDNKYDEYVFYDIDEIYLDYTYGLLLDEDIDGKLEKVELELNDIMYPADLFIHEDKNIYVLESEEAVIEFTKEERPFVGSVTTMDESGNFLFDYYLQGYESDRLQNIIRLIHDIDYEEFVELVDEQEVRSLGETFEDLSDRQNALPSVLTFNGSLMGFFIIAAYIFLDKQEGIIKAYAVTASAVWEYLLSKVFVLMVVSVISSFIIVIPIMRLDANYLMMFVLLITSSFFISSLGLLFSTYFDSMTKSFGGLYAIMIVLMLPAIAYYIPSWEPTWITFLPTHHLIAGFRETLISNGDINYILFASGIFIAVGLVCFVAANYRFKKTLCV